MEPDARAEALRLWVENMRSSVEALGQVLQPIVENAAKAWKGFAKSFVSAVEAHPELFEEFLREAEASKPHTLTTTELRQLLGPCDEPPVRLTSEGGFLPIGGNQSGGSCCYECKSDWNSCHFVAGLSYSCLKRRIVSRNARLKWESAGRPRGRDLEFWLEAESEFLPQSLLWHPDGTEWHAGPQWSLWAVDLENERKQIKGFAMSGIHGWRPA